MRQHIVNVWIRIREYMLRTVAQSISLCDCVPRNAIRVCESTQQRCVGAPKGRALNIFDCVPTLRCAAMLFAYANLHNNVVLAQQAPN